MSENNQVDTNLENKIQVKEIIFQREDIEIYYDKDYKIRVITKARCTENIIKAKEIVTQINNLPMSKKMRSAYGMEISNIYQIAYNTGIEQAEHFGKMLLSDIENVIITVKKIIFIIPSIICMLVAIISGNIANSYGLVYADAFIYGPIGGILSIIINQKDIKIDYKVETYILVIESIKMIFISALVAIIGIIAIKSKFLFANIDFTNNVYMTYLILIICGYSQSFIPNLLNKLTKDLK